MNRPRRLTKQYKFPIRCFAACSFLVAQFSILYHTARARLLLSVLGCPYGRHLRVDGKVIVRVHRKGAVSIGDNVTINSRFMANLVGVTGPTVFHCIREGAIHVGDNSGCSSTIFSSRASISVGRNVKIGGNVRIYDHDYHSLDYLERRDPDTDAAGVASKPIVIGDDVFIGVNSIILKGVTIGDRSIIGAGSVVAINNIPSDSLVAGNPARVIRSLKAEAKNAP